MQQSINAGMLTFMTDIIFGFICELEVFQSAAHDYFGLKTVRDWETYHRSDEPFSDMSELKNIIFFLQDVHIQSQQESYIKAEW